VEPPADLSDEAGFRKRLYDRKRAFYQQLLRKGSVDPRPGIVPFIERALDEGIALGAASTCAKEGALTILNEVLGPELTSRFSTIKAGNDVEHRKPAPDIYLLGLSGLGLPADCCIAVEDSRHGLLAAKAAGL